MPEHRQLKPVGVFKTCKQLPRLQGREEHGSCDLPEVLKNVVYYIDLLDLFSKNYGKETLPRRADSHSRLLA